MEIHAMKLRCMVFMLMLMSEKVGPLTVDPWKI